MIKPRVEQRYTIHVNRMGEPQRLGYARYFADDVAKRLRDGKWIDLRRFLSVRAGATLEVFVFGTDALSGTRTMAHKQYAESAIQVGRFMRRSFRHTGALHDDPENEVPDNLED